MKILGIETSCDDTCAAVLIDDKVISNVISSQTDLHKDWGGVVPDIAKRAHAARIKSVIATALMRAKSKIQNSKIKNKEERIEKIIEHGMKEIDVIAVTKGPGLAIALSVGVNTAKEMAKKYNKKLVAVNHIEGHILSNLVKNSSGLPEVKIVFPALCLTASGGHTKIILINQNYQNSKLKIQNSKNEYLVVGETLDDAAGEALDKAAKLLGLGYPGGPVIERLAKGAKTDFIPLPKPLADKKILDYSFSGLKTSFYYKIKDWPKEEVNKNLGNLAATFQESVFETLLRKFDLAIDRFQPKTLMASGGVLANMDLRKKLRRLAKKKGLMIYMPVKKWLNTDNAAMIGRVGWEMAKREEWADPETLDRDPRMELGIRN
ncbi:tRNA (adenosine(37)-N6)-threonylcarbamoyltransferase complex transferase subunit TsaD [Candidatus Shapirobacteria bacterium]|nr:tRNA (adenosine(37)-N6)-threonylcarbamoyltransferase complex transferase subunit TsaD [Candidatus Shapirobacteria bacterium]